MIEKFSFIPLILLVFQLSGQTAISGYVDMKDRQFSERKVYLSKMAIKDFPYSGNIIQIASSPISEEGYFEFQRSLIEEKEAVYRIYVNRFEKTLNDTISIDKLFLFSNDDTIFFKNSNSLFSAFTNTNDADAEWQSLRNYETKLRNLISSQEDSLSDAYINNIKSYAKDSLQILMVKLISIKQLDIQDLLVEDILKNQDYYIELLAELKSSDIERSEYLFLENKLSFHIAELAKNKYQSSMFIIVLLILSVIGLYVFIWRRREKNSSSLFIEANLSKQERKIQSLILEGKSNKEIANELFISLSTVKSHISNIYNKLQISDRQELLQKYQN